jgi:hypothetical protein
MVNYFALDLNGVHLYFKIDIGEDLRIPSTLTTVRKTETEHMCPLCDEENGICKVFASSFAFET